MVKNAVRSVIGAFCVMGAAAAAMTGAAGATEKTVNIYNWTDYIGPTTLEDFTKATGIKTNYDTYTDLETLEAKLLTGKSGYDIVVPTAEPTLGKLIQAKAVRKLDKSKIPNLKNLDPALMARVASTDPGNEYAAIYQWGTIGIGYNPEKVKALLPNAPTDSWKLIFDPANAKVLAKCGIVFLDSPADVLPTAFAYLGLDPNSENPEDLKKAAALVTAIRPYIKAFVPSTIDPLATGDACVAFSYSGDAIQAIARVKEAGGKPLAYSIPKEAAELWFDTLAVPVDAPNPDAAFAYINFVLQPKVMAGISDVTSYPNAVAESKPLLDKEISGNPNIYPSAEQMAKFFTVKHVSQKADKERTRAWTRIKTGT
jgi:putrescine transport system substrate-binding protein